MADQDQYNDEYKFSDLDNLNPDSVQDEDEQEGDSYSTSAKDQPTTNIRRNALIAVGIALLAMLLYNIFGRWFSEPHETAKKATIPAVSQPSMPALPKTLPASPQPISPAVSPTLSSGGEQDIRQKLGALELNQQTVHSEITSVNNQMGSMSSQMSELGNRLNRLGQMIEQLSNQLEQQSQDISRLRIQTKPVQRTRITPRKAITPRLTYFIQAVIPGRAWLIASNGSTLTVREGSNISGYGVVKLIDPIQGKVVTSSGQVIRFSQQDS